MKKLVDTYPRSDFAAEALYYLGVCRYMASNDAEQLMGPGSGCKRNIRQVPGHGGRKFNTVCNPKCHLLFSV